MRDNKTHICLAFLLIFIALWSPATGSSGMTALHQSVEKAISSNPQLQILDHNRHALTFDLKQSYSGYRPRVDLTFGYGLDQHSDRTTRAPNANPGDSEWDTRENATLAMTQKIYDGGETGSQVSIGEAQVDSATHQLQAAKQAIALDAVTTHLEVVRQRELVALSENNLKAHRDIYQLLAEREQAGAGSIADVDQVRARKARAESTVHSSRAELSVANANYVRVIGSPPDRLAFSGVPDTLPQTLEAVLLQTRQKSPELLALDAERIAADSRLMLAQSKYRPKLDLELSSRYNNRVEGDPSWEATNTAMLSLRWNLYNGGNDKAGTLAAQARLEQSLSKRTSKWVELKESISTAWATRFAFQHQKAAFRDAVAYSRKTFDAYLNQFSVSKRTLLDVLIAENDFFQSATQLVEVTINETIAAYRVLALMGALEVPRCEGECTDADDFEGLTNAIAFPSTLKILSQSSHGIAQGPAHVEALEGAPVLEPHFDDTRQLDAIKSNSHQSVEIGPLIRQSEVLQTIKTLENMGFSVRQKNTTGPVAMFRLFEGVYPPAQARKRLVDLKRVVDSAFVLPQTGGLGLYAGSFRTSERASLFKEDLGRRQIDLEIVESEVEMHGTLLMVEKIDLHKAERIFQRVSQLAPSPAVIIR